MADTVATLVEDVLTVGGFETSEAEALKSLTRCQRQMCARSRCYRKKLNVGTTASGVQEYALPAGVTEIFELQVGGVVFGAGRHQDLAEGAQGWIWLGGEGGVFTRDDDTTGATKIALFPIPTSGGATTVGAEIAAFAAVQPPDITAGLDSSIVIPPNFIDALTAGAVSRLMRRLEGRPDLAA